MNKQKSDTTVNYDGLRFPPKALEVEEAVLGAMLLERDAPGKVLDVLSAESFYTEANQLIFKAIKHLYGKNEPVDVLTVTNILNKGSKLEAAGGAYNLANLTGKVASSANIEFHAKILTQKQIQRDLIKVSNRILEKAYEETGDAFELLDIAEKEFFAIKDQGIKKSFESIDNLIVKAVKQIDQIRKSDKEFVGIPSGYKDLDKITGGFQNSDLIILAARPGMGKTAFALNVARNAAIQFQKPVAIFSLEMSSLQLITRLIASETGINSEKLRNGRLSSEEWIQLQSRLNKLAESNIFVDDTAQLNIFDLRAKARRLKSHHNIELLVIDYLQLMRGDAGPKANREQEISHISRSLKGLAKELDIPIIALAQLSRAVESRHDKRPILSDLRESGSIEQDADIVSFLYRPDYYGQTTDENGNDIAGIAELIVAKHRNGKTDKINLRFIGDLAKFENLSYHQHENPHWTETEKSTDNEIDAPLF